MCCTFNRFILLQRYTVLLTHRRVIVREMVIEELLWRYRVF